jgi:exonuclease SbcC
MSMTDASFDALRDAIRSLWPPDELKHIELEAAADVLLLHAPNDVAAFAVLNGHPDREFPDAYNTFKRLYRENSSVWDERTLSFVVCRSSDHPEDDRFYAALETDPLFCRKYVIRTRATVGAQRDGLLRLPFLPLPVGGDVGLQRPQAAQDLLRSAGFSATFARNLIEPGKKAAGRIAEDLRDGRESLPSSLTPLRNDRLTVTAPRASSRLLSLTVEGFRAYRDPQTFDLNASVIVLYGPNGLGKTSLFDAIDYACTGRIGRLHRARQTQSDFSRIATHLDKTPGSGSVVLLVKENGVADRTWKLQRSTGNWTTAWIDGQEADRKDVINKLTQANWVDTTPRQQTLDSLFRATHLFGQDEQELLTEFRKGSVIPEAFISEMLSLQDYSQGLSKIGEVLSTLSDHRKTADGELEQLQEQATALRTSLNEDAGDSGNELLPLESAVASLRSDIEQSELKLDPLPELSTSSAYTEWLDVVASRQKSADDRMQLAQTLRDQLPLHCQIRSGGFR